MANSAMTFTYKKGEGIDLIKCTWTSDDSTGAVSGTTTQFFTGDIHALITDPGSPSTFG